MLVDAIHAARGRCAAIVINPGAFTHYAWAIHDALAAFDGPVVELHLSDPNAREPWRHPRWSTPVAGRHHRRLRRRRLPPRPRRRRRARLAAAWRRRRPGGPRAELPAAIPDLGSLAAMDVAGRAARLQAALADAEVDALLVTDLTNIRYLTGFTGSAALLLVTARRPHVRHRRPLRPAGRGPAGRGRASTAAIEVSSTGQKAVVADAVGAAGAARLGPGGRRRSPGRRSAPTTSTGSPASSWCPPPAWSAALRLLKDDGEIDRIAAACAIADAALAAGAAPAGRRRPPRSSSAWSSTPPCAASGADDVSFETIVASGPNGALPHHRPGHRTIVEGDLVVIDFGALVDGYHSDMTRTVMVGEPVRHPAAHVRRRPARPRPPAWPRWPTGSAAKAVDDACRAVIDEAGWADAFLHGTGHGVGLDIHEDPRVGQTSTATLSSRCVVTVEPGVYLPEHGGVRIEDTVVVTADGCRPVTLTPKPAAV